MKSAQTKGSSSIERTYQKKTQIEHVLLRPDSYVGSCEPETKEMWVFDDKTNKIVQKSITYIPGLYKIFDEILVNAADNYQRDKSMSQIKVSLNQSSITVYNNGKSIPVAIHPKEKIYVPELVFGHLLTSSNYDDSDKKVTGGRNGFGAKLTNIFSKKFTVTVCDPQKGKKYTQVFKSNLSTIEEPKITDFDKDCYPYTEITFEPDFKRFGISNLSSDMLALMQKRVYDLAGVTGQSVSVYLNNKKIQVKNFQDYCGLYLDNDALKFTDKNNQRWEFLVTQSDTGFQFQQVSFVNSICTTRGGSHVEYISNQITDALIAHMQKKNKKLELKRQQVKQNLWIFVNCLIENPAFDSQTKDTLTTPFKNFGSKCEVSETCIKKICNSPILEQIQATIAARQNAQLKKALGTGRKQNKLYGIPKLEDANHAGTQSSRYCTLILTEGDSAKALAMSGLQVVGRDNYGVFPLKGKLLNVRDASQQQILSNEEIQNVIKILGLNLNQKYQRIEELNLLRYGKLMIMADQDHDGSHIKGLLINFIHHFWPNLLKHDFIQQFVTPIIKATKGSDQREFFTLNEYENWYSQLHNKEAFNIKYYKGLGTSTANEAKQYFKSLQRHVIKFKHNQKQTEDEAIELAFSKKKVDDRKQWLSCYDPDKVVDHQTKVLGYQEFIDKELIHFSIADNIRSIPNVVDGLKPGQRKIMFSMFKRVPSGQMQLKHEIKVAQLAGYVSEHSAYHHGEMSLCSTIINMAQDFTFSNNLNLLMPIGQFGTRSLGGKDFASSRYIYTNLSPLTKLMFPEADLSVLKNQKEEGMVIEPVNYTPILPMALINGAEGIGTGWATLIPQFNPVDLAENIKRKILNQKMVPMTPWLRGFSGQITPKEQENNVSFTTFGTFKIVQNTMEIKELPYRCWTRDYKSFLEGMAQAGEIDDLKEYHKDNNVHFKFLIGTEIEQIYKKEGDMGIVKKFRLSKDLNLTNMVLFNGQNLKKYTDPREIIDDFYPEREKTYVERKVYQLQKLKDEVSLLNQKSRFIRMVNEGTLTFKKCHSKQEAIQSLKQHNFTEQSGSFDFLLNMPIWSLSQEKIVDLETKMKEKQAQLDKLEKLSIQDIWISEVDAFIQAYKESLNSNYSSPVQNNIAADRILNVNASQNRKVQSHQEPAKKPESHRKVIDKTQISGQKRTVTQKSPQTNKVDEDDGSSSEWDDSSSHSEFGDSAKVKAQPSSTKPTSNDTSKPTKSKPPASQNKPAQKDQKSKNSSKAQKIESDSDESPLDSSVEVVKKHVSASRRDLKRKQISESSSQNNDSENDGNHSDKSIKKREVKAESKQTTLSFFDQSSKNKQAEVEKQQDCETIQMKSQAAAAPPATIETQNQDSIKADQDHNPQPKQLTLRERLGLPNTGTLIDAVQKKSQSASPQKMNLDQNRITTQEFLQVVDQFNGKNDQSQDQQEDDDEDVVRRPTKRRALNEDSE